MVPSMTISLDEVAETMTGTKYGAATEAMAMGTMIWITP
jgi:hypothetical protein